MSVKGAAIQTSTFAGSIIVLVGPAGSGKSTLLQQLKARTVPTVTTRRPRRLESAGNGDHIFVTKDQFMSMQNNDELVCIRRFLMLDQGSVKYGIRRVDLDAVDDLAVVLDPGGAFEIKSLYPDRVKLFWLTVPNRDERIRRLIERGDSEESIITRLKADSIDFARYKGWDYAQTDSLYNNF